MHYRLEHIVNNTKSYIEVYRKKNRAASSKKEYKTDGWIEIGNGNILIDHFEACKFCGQCDGKWMDKDNSIKKCIIPCG